MAVDGRGRRVWIAGGARIKLDASWRGTLRRDGRRGSRAVMVDDVEGPLDIVLVVVFVVVAVRFDVLLVLVVFLVVAEFVVFSSPLVVLVVVSSC